MAPFADPLLLFSVPDSTIILICATGTQGLPPFSMMHLRIYFFLSVAALLLLPVVSPADEGNQGKEQVDWPGYLGGPDSGHYSTLDQINRDNVHRLELAWVYRSGGRREDNRSQILCNPLIIDGVLYGTSADLTLFAINAATGDEIWTFDTELIGQGHNRGLSYWEDGDDKRILYPSKYKLYAIDVGTGKPITAFGENGSVDLHEGLGRDVTGLYIAANSPGRVFKNLLILGTRVSESLPAVPGFVRAYDIRTGKIVWTFRTIPRPGDFGYDTWPPDAWKRTGGANCWTGMSLDHKRGIVYVPTGSASFDYYGGDRLGANLFANTLLALNANTGERIWHFQAVHHDIWDRDLPAPPNLVTVTHDGKRIDAVAQITKSAHIFLFDRETGKPLFPIEERPFPPSDLDGEQAWKTQPIPVKPPPFTRQHLSEDILTDISPEARANALEMFKQYRTGGQFIPPSREGTLIYPGLDGGGEWGGAAFDPKTGILFVNGNELPWRIQMVEVSGGDKEKPVNIGRLTYALNCQQCHGIDLEGSAEDKFPSLVDIASRFNKEQFNQLIKEGKGDMPSFGYLTDKQNNALISYLYNEQDVVQPAQTQDPDRPLLTYALTGHKRFLDKNGNPAVKPPWSTLNAIDLNTGDFVWKVPLGDFPEFRKEGDPPTGAEGYGGPIVTAGGVIFIGATRDEKFRAFDKRDGKLLWETGLPAGGYATPSTYSVDGTQYVVIACGGSKMGTKSGDAYLAFKLKK